MTGSLLSAWEATLTLTVRLVGRPHYDFVTSTSSNCANNSSIGIFDRDFGFYFSNRYSSNNFATCGKDKIG